jgi:hypothetical protein
MQLPGIYRFDDADAGLSLLPMAARRALDCAGLHLSLRGWQKLGLESRQALVRLGSEDSVDGPRVRQALVGCDEDVREEAPLEEPAAALGPSSELLQQLSGELSPLWTRLTALDRYVLMQLSRRGKRERVAQAWAEIRERRAL